MTGKDIEKIVLHYADGTAETVNKGFIADMIPSEDEETCEITFHMVHISGNELSNIIESVVGLGIKLGMFGGNEDG